MSMRISQLELSCGGRYALHTFQDWSEETTQNWLMDLGLPAVVPSFAEHSISGVCLPYLNHALLRDMGIGLVGDRCRLLILFKRLWLESDPANRIRPAVHITSLHNDEVGNRTGSGGGDPQLKSRPDGKGGQLPLSISTSPSQLNPALSAVDGNQASFKPNPQASSQLKDLSPTEADELSSTTFGWLAKSSAKSTTLQNISPVLVTPQSGNRLLPQHKMGSFSVQTSPAMAQARLNKMGSSEPSMVPVSAQLSSGTAHSFTSEASLERSVGKRVVRVIGEEGQLRTVDVTGVTDARSFYVKVFVKFSILPARDKDNLVAVEREMDQWGILLVDKKGEAPVGVEADAIPRLNLRKLHSQAERRKVAKLEKIFGERLRPELQWVQKDEGFLLSNLMGNGKLRDFFGQRPPSEMITTNLAKFFPSIPRSNSTSRLKFIPDNATAQGAPASTPSHLKDMVDMKDEGDPYEYEFEEGAQPESQRPSVGLPREEVVGQVAKSSQVTRPYQALDEAVTGVPAISPGNSIDAMDAKGSSSFSNPRSTSSLTKRKSVVKKIKWVKGALIGTGSFGNVYLGLNQLNGELMAVKQVTLPAEVPDDGSGRPSPIQNRRRVMVEALQREILLLKELEHPNIVRYLGSESTADYLNIFLEYVPGGSLSHLLGNYGTFEEGLIKLFVRQILNGLVYLHDKNIIHRDIKGGNILVDNKGIVKITDFGISKKIVNPAGERDRASVISLYGSNPPSRNSTLQGSVFWMAPEVVKQYIYTKKADIWSLGCLMIEMCTGQRPWAGLEQMQAMYKIGSNESPPYPTDISLEARMFLDSCFELNYRDRCGADQLIKMPFMLDEADPSMSAATEPNLSAAPNSA